MTHREEVLGFLSKIAPQPASNSEIVSHTHIKPHQQVFQLTRKLVDEGLITGRRVGREWYFSREKKVAGELKNLPAQDANLAAEGGRSSRPSEFERLRQRTMSGKQRTAATRTVHIDFTDALVLVSCVKSKLPRKAPARDLYTSTLFSGIRNIVDSRNLDWFVLSALHGLVDPLDSIEPYERTLNNMRISDRRDWASNVLETLLPVAKKYRKVVFFAGAKYREFLVDPLRQLGIEVVVPMEGLPLGKQLSWLNQFDSSPRNSFENTSHAT